IVTIAVPVVDAGGRIALVAGGSLDLSKFRSFIEPYNRIPDTRITIVDQHDRVIYASSDAGYAPLQTLTDDSLVRAAGGANPEFRYTRRTEARIADARLAAVSRITSVGWRVFVDEPLIALRLQSTGYYALTLT